MSERAIHFGTFFFKFACLMLVEAALAVPTFGEVGALN